MKEEEPASELVIDLPIDTEEENDRKHPFEVKPALEDDFDKEEEEPVFEVSNDTKEEDQAYRGDMSQPYNPRLDLEFYRFPTLDLLNTYQNDEPDIDMEEQNANKNRIIKVLRSFGIEISSIKASVGPTITLYEITPAEGVRISKIRNLEDDIALSLSALGIRIIAPIPGKGTIGIEVPAHRAHEFHPDQQEVPGNNLRPAGGTRKNHYQRGVHGGSGQGAPHAGGRCDRSR